LEEHYWIFTKVMLVQMKNTCNLYGLSVLLLSQRSHYKQKRFSSQPRVRLYRLPHRHFVFSKMLRPYLRNNKNAVIHSDAFELYNTLKTG
jgi:hypothetical protein